MFDMDNLPANRLFTTGKERLDTLLAGGRIDRVLLFPFLLGFCAVNTGNPISTIYSDAEKSFDMQTRTLEQYGFDWGPIYGYASYGTWEFGGDIEMPQGEYQQAPSHGRFPVNSKDDLEGLVLPDREKAGCIPLAMEFSRLQAETGSPVSVVMGGPFTIAGNICPVEKLCRWIIKRPATARKILEFAVDHIIDIVGYWVETFGSNSVIPQIWEPLASNRIISPLQFRDFVLPHLKRASEGMLEAGTRHILFHICGEQNANLPFWAEVEMGNPGLCSFGAEVDMERVLELFGGKAVIIGNVDPSLLLKGPPDRIYAECRMVIETCKDSPNGFMLSSGCEVSPMTPGYNLYLMKKAVDTFGLYE